MVCVLRFSYRFDKGLMGFVGFGGVGVAVFGGFRRLSMRVR